MNSTKDKLRPVEIKNKLQTAIIGRNIIYYEKIDSTNKAAAEFANKGADEGTIVIADEQTKGRGRLDRNWISPPYANILMSLIIRPSLPVDKHFYLTMIASIAIIKAIKEITGLMTSIKWPNDVYRNNKKLAGILTELKLNHNKIDYAVIGIGLNVNSDFSVIAEIKNTATSLLMECGEKISRTILLCSIIETFETKYLQLKQNEYENIRKQWENNSLIIGKQVILSSGDYSEYGIAESLAVDGSLVLVKANNEKKKIITGDVSLRLAE